MFITLNPVKFKDQFAAYSLTDSAGRLLFVGIGRLPDILSLPGAPSNWGAETSINMIISTPVDDYMRAANDALMIATDANRADLVEVLKGAVDKMQRPPKRAGRPVECIETGQRYFSTTAAAEANNASYCALQKHLKGAVGYKSVKGHTYRYV